MTQDMQKGPVSRAEQHEIGGTSEFGNKNCILKDTATNSTGSYCG